MQPRDRLSSKEIQVGILVWEGLTNRDIADRLGTSEQVVKNYLRSTFDKLGVWSRLELAPLRVRTRGCAMERTARNTERCALVLRHLAGRLKTRGGYRR